MIIPVRCFTCREVIGNKYDYYLRKVRQGRESRRIDQGETIYLDLNKIEKTVEGGVLDNLGIVKICCRRHFLTHVDIE